MRILLVDFGSTYTKLVAVDTQTATIIATAKSITTIQTSILDGYNDALSQLFSEYGVINFDEIRACSSAAGGLKMTAIGLVEELTVEASKMACLGAGSRLSAVYSSKLSIDEVKEIEQSDVDIILLAGGIDGGNEECVMHNASLLANSSINVPIIYAGNKTCSDQIKAILSSKDLYVTSNVMAKLNELSIDDAQDVIRQIFIETIIDVKKMADAVEVIGDIVMPTPHAVLMAMELLSVGFEDEAGLGDLVLFDIGGATTDVHSICKGFPKRGDVMLKGLVEPFAKRTVEGDLGMRYSLNSLYENIGQYNLSKYFSEDVNILDEVLKRVSNIKYVPKNEKDLKIESGFAAACVDYAFSRHVGKLETVYTPLGQAFYQTGKDLTKVNYIIGTGGVIVNSVFVKEIMSASLYKMEHENQLRPVSCKFLIDRSYIISAMGLLSEIDPKCSLKILKNYLVEE